MAKSLFKNAATHLPEYCRPTAEIMSMLGDKWSIAVLGTLSGGRLRFSELESQIGGISQRMLTLTLRSLVRDGLVVRIVAPAVPTRVDYELSERGLALREPMFLLHDWATQHMPAIVQSRRDFDAEAQQTA